MRRSSKQIGPRRGNVFYLEVHEDSMGRGHYWLLKRTSQVLARSKRYARRRTCLHAANGVLEAWNLSHPPLVLRDLATEQTPNRKDVNDDNAETDNSD